MPETTLKIAFPGVSTSEAGSLAADLQQEIEMMGEGVTVQRVRDNPDTQDFGATLLLVLGTPAVIALAKGIAAWMKRTGTGVTVKCGDKEIVVKNVDSANLPAMLQAACK